MAGEDARPPRVIPRCDRPRDARRWNDGDGLRHRRKQGEPPGASPYTFRGRLTLALRRNGAGYLFLLPWLVGFFGLTLLPTLASLYLSFTDYDLLTPPRWSGLANYDYAFFADERFRTALGVTFRYVVWSVPLKLVVALALALVLDKGVRGITVYRAIFYLPSLLGSSVAIAVLCGRSSAMPGSPTSCSRSSAITATPGSRIRTMRS